MGHSQSKHSAHQPTSSHPPSTPYDSHADFTYTPLNHPRHFRILHLKRIVFQGSGDWKDTVLSGTLVETSLDNVPEYFALSYTWGDSTLCDYILIDGRVLKITRSCAAALRRMLKGKLERVIWVDSICINQARDTQATQERSTQVAFMDEIYNKAIQVNVYLGEGDERTEVAAKAVNRLGVASLAVLGARKIGVGEETMRRQYEKVADEVLQISQEFPYGKLHPILRLPWFRRVWVFQEVVLARKVVFYCGERLIAFENLAFATDFTRVPYSKPDSLALHWRSYLEGHNACIRLLRLKEKGEDAKLRHQYLLTIVANLDVTQPEDKIHAMYGYAKRMELDWPIPDYTKSVAQIYTEVTIACFRQSEDLGVILMAIGPASEEFGLPSWVPDFSRRFTDYSPSKPPKIDLVPFRNKQCSGATECDWILEPDGRRLKVKGRKVDYITAISEPWQADSTTTLLGGADFNSGQIFDSLIECIGSWYEVALQRSMTRNGGTDSANQFVAISDLAGLLASAHLGRTTPPDQFAEHISVLISCTRRDMVALRTVFIHPDNDNDQLRIAPQIQQAIECLTPLIWKLIFRTTAKSCMGISNYNANAGDLLVVLYGIASPCVMRPCAGGFNFIGGAFVPELMNGEFWEGGSDKDDEWFTLM